ncbi:MAG: nucleoside-diphosphate kinase [Nanoarchaeota archaeon]
MMEKSLVLIKPDAVQRGLVGEIISRFERCGLKIISMKMVYADKEIAGQHYADDESWMQSVGEKAKKSAEKRGETLDVEPVEIGRRVREQLMDYISMSPIVALVIEGHGAVKKIRRIVGDTNPQESAPGTIRGDYTIDSYQMADASGRPIQNLIHASGEVEEAEREIKIWFEEAELHAWRRVDEMLIYRKNTENR